MQRLTLDVKAAAWNVTDADQVDQRIDFEHRFEQLELEPREAFEQQDVDLLLNDVDRETHGIVECGIGPSQLDAVDVLALRLGLMSQGESPLRRGRNEQLADLLLVFLEDHE